MNATDNKKFIEGVAQMISEQNIADYGDGYEYLCEMATVGTPTIDNERFKIVIRGSANNDRETPHVHIYLRNDVPAGRTFNFEVSLIDILTKNQINLVKQLDFRHRNHRIDKRNREECSWDNYTGLLQGFYEFLRAAPVGKYKRSYPNAQTNLELMTHIWNAESNDDTVDDPLGKYLQERNLVVLPEYRKYFPEIYTETR